MLTSAIQLQWAQVILLFLIEIKVIERICFENKQNIIYFLDFRL